MGNVIAMLGVGQPTYTTTDDKGNGYANYGEALDSNANNGCRVACARVVTTGPSFTVTVSMFQTFIAYEIGGVDPSVMFDGTPTGVASWPTNSTAISCPMGTLTNAEDLLLAIIQPSSAEAVTPLGGFATEDDYHTNYMYIMSQTTSAALGAINATGTMSASDVYTITAVAFKSAGSSGTTYSDTLTEAGAGADALATAAAYSSAVAETGTAADALAAAASLAATIAEAGAASDALLAALAVSAPVTEAAAAADALQTALTAAAAIAEAGVAVDAYSTALSASASVVEAGVAGDALATKLTTSPALAEPASAADSVSNGSVYAGAVTEAGSAADSLASAAVMPAPLDEPGAAADSLGSVASLHASLTEAAAGGDTAAGAAAMSAPLTETVSAADTVTGSTAGVVYSDTLAEAGAAVDALTASWTAANALAEALAASDSLTTSAALSSALREAGAALDALAANVNGFANTPTIREQILIYLAGRLQTATGITFYRSREAPVTRAEGMVGILWPEEEQIDYRASRLSMRSFVVRIAVIARADVPDSAADMAVAKIHGAITGDLTLGGLCGLVVDESTKWNFELADQNAVAIEMRYRIRYSTAFSDLTSSDSFAAALGSGTLAYTPAAASTVREQMLAYLATRLGPATGFAFYRSREAPVTRSEGVVGVLYPEEETVEYRGNRLALRTFIVKLVVVARAAIPDSAADTAVADIHAAVMKDATLGGLCGVIVDDTVKWDFALADQNAVGVEMRYRIKYATTFNDLTAVA